MITDNPSSRSLTPEKCLSHQNEQLTLSLNISQALGLEGVGVGEMTATREAGLQHHEPTDE